MTLSRYAENGILTPARIAGALRTTRDEIAQTAGLGRDAILRKERVASQKTQKRLREMVEILNKIEPRFGSDLIAYAWYRSEPLPGFSGQTAMQLVRAGRAADVLEYVDAVDAGVFCLTPIDHSLASSIAPSTPSTPATLCPVAALKCTEAASIRRERPRSMRRCRQ